MSLFEIATEIDVANVDIYRIRNLLTLYEQQIESNIAFLDNNPDESKLFVSDYDLLRTVLDVIQAKTTEVEAIIKKQVDILYELSKTQKPNEL